MQHTSPKFNGLHIASVLPYYGYKSESYYLMKNLSKTTRKILYDCPNIIDPCVKFIDLDPLETYVFIKWYYGKDHYKDSLLNQIIAKLHSRESYLNTILNQHLNKELLENQNGGFPRAYAAFVVH